MKTKRIVIFTSVLFSLSISSCQKEQVTANFNPNAKAYHDFTPKEKKSLIVNIETQPLEKEVSILKTPTKPSIPETEISIKTDKPKTNNINDHKDGKRNKKIERQKKRASKFISHLENSKKDKSFSFSALASFLYGLISALVFPYALLIGPIAIIAGFHTLKKMKNNPDYYKGKGFAIAGIILAFLAILIFISNLMTFILFGETIFALLTILF